jgi:hypothetical protein
MAAEIVQDDDLARLQHWDQDLLNPGEKHRNTAPSIGPS